MMDILADRLDDGSWRCHSCAHECLLSGKKRGICGMRSVQGKQLLFPHGRISSLAADPWEKKPLYHVRPGTRVLSFGGLGCNFTCPFCQNWEISQVRHDETACGTSVPCTSEQLVESAKAHGCTGIAATYNEPLISTEWVAEILGRGKQAGLLGGLVSNGFGSERTWKRLFPVLDAVNIDLKCFTDSGYRLLGGRLGPVMEGIRAAHQNGIWVEVTTLVVPGFNEDEKELQELADFLASVSVDIPWHISAWHDDYQWHPGPSQTSMESLGIAYDCGRQAGLHFIYTGNVGSIWAHEVTRCPACGKELIHRRGFRIGQNLLNRGCCPECGTAISGRW